MSDSGVNDQHSRWLLYEIEPGSAAHCITATARFPGSPDIQAMKYVLHALAAQHPTLRMTFPPGGGPARRRARVAAVCIREDNSHDLDDGQFAQGLVYAAQEPFDLARGPRLRVHVYHRPEDETVVLVVAHRFIADVWSMMTLVREFETLYIERAGGGPAPLPDPVAGDKELDRLYRWVGGTRASVHAAANHGSGARLTGGKRRSGVALRPGGARAMTSPRARSPPRPVFYRREIARHR